jgi:hypothetical protein
MPTRIQLILAHGFRIATFGTACVAVVIVSWFSFGIVADRPDPLVVTLVIVSIIAAFPLGLIVGGLTVWPVLFITAGKLNGAPFHEGELVYVLVGPHKGRMTTVYKVWPSRRQARVWLNDQAKIEVKDVYMWNEICR